MRNIESLSGGDQLRNPTLVLDKDGKIKAPLGIEKIINRNRDLWNSVDNNIDFENKLDVWTDEIALGIKKIRGDVNEAPKVSIVVPAYNEESYILQLLDSISKQKTSIATEVIIVVNDSTDRTANFVRKCGAEIIEYNIDGQYPPVAYARQKGLEQAKGEIILSTDADMIVGEYWVDELTKPLINNESTVISIGNVNVYEEKLIPASLVNVINTISRKHEIKSKKSISIVPWSNIAFRKKDIAEIGGWPQEPFMEDTILVRKFKNIGKPELCTRPEATIWTSGRRAMLSINEFFEDFKKGGNHFLDKNGKLKIVR